MSKRMVYGSVSEEEDVKIARQGVEIQWYYSAL